jgi:ribosomal protein S18 acetylase RimI-like enzyme
MRVRPATEGDAPALAALDASYTAGERVLLLTYAGAPPDLDVSMRWQPGEAHEEVYGDYSNTTGALAKTDLFLVAEHDGAAVGLLMVIVPSWTDAGEITDLVVDRGHRRSGAGRALVIASVGWARERKLRGLWVEPRADNADAIQFYLRRGFRLSGYNDRWNSNADDAPGRQTIYMYLGLG